MRNNNLKVFTGDRDIWELPLCVCIHSARRHSYWKGSRSFSFL